MISVLERFNQFHDKWAVQLLKNLALKHHVRNRLSFLNILLSHLLDGHHGFGKLIPRQEHLCKRPVTDLLDYLIPLHSDENRVDARSRGR